MRNLFEAFIYGSLHIKDAEERERNLRQGLLAFTYFKEKPAEIDEVIRKINLHLGVESHVLVSDLILDDTWSDIKKAQTEMSIYQVDESQVGKYIMLFEQSYSDGKKKVFSDDLFPGLPTFHQRQNAIDLVRYLRKFMRFERFDLLVVDGHVIRLEDRL